VVGRVCGALRCVPRDGARITSLDRSGAVLAHTLDPAQRATAEAAAALLASRGIVLAGLDLVGPWLIEANVTSAGGEWYYNRVWPAPLAPSVWDALERAVAARGAARSTSGAMSDHDRPTSVAP
jgi:glutathione synthase